MALEISQALTCFSNIDRLFALWQKLHPGKWFSDKNRAAEALKPFRKNEVGEYWTSNEIYETADLGYTYPILPKKSVIQNGQSIVVLDRTTEELNEEINGLYGSTRRAEQKAALTDERTETITVEDALRATEPVKVQAQIAEKFARLPDEPKVEDHLGVPDYVVALKYERYVCDLLLHFPLLNPNSVKVRFERHAIHNQRPHRKSSYRSDPTGRRRVQKPNRPNLQLCRASRNERSGSSFVQLRQLRSSS